MVRATLHRGCPLCMESHWLLDDAFQTDWWMYKITTTAAEVKELFDRARHRVFFKFILISDYCDILCFVISDSPSAPEAFKLMESCTVRKDIIIVTFTAVTVQRDVCYCFQFSCVHKRNTLSSCRKNHRTCKWKINRGADSLPHFNTRMSIASLSSTLVYWNSFLFWGLCVLTLFWCLCAKVADTPGAILEYFFFELGIYRVHCVVE